VRQGDLVAPHGVQVGAHDDGREARCGLVEQLPSGGVRPEAVAVAVPDEHAVGDTAPSCSREAVGGLLGRGAVGHVDPAADERPLVEVHVVVAEARSEPRALCLDDLDVGAGAGAGAGAGGTVERVERAGRRDGGDPPTDDQDVGGGAGGAHPSDGAEQGRRHHASRPVAVASWTRAISSASAGEA
jgi:hypothetical protein